MAEFAADNAESKWIDTFSSLDPKAYLNQFLSENTRSDGRLASSCRPTTVHKHVLTRNAAGSALVRLGDTQCLAAVSLLVGQPAAEYGTLGDVTVSLQQPHQPQHLYAAASSWLQRVLVDSDWIDRDELSIVPGQSAWRLQVIIMILCNDGNVKDASLLAAVAALTDTMMPATTVDAKGVVQLRTDKNGTKLSLRMPRIPIPLTVGWYSSPEEQDSAARKFLVDPSDMEQQHIVESCITVVVAVETRKVLHVDTAGHPALSAQDLARVVQMAFGRAQELQPLLRTTS